MDPGGEAKCHNPHLQSVHFWSRSWTDTSVPPPPPAYSDLLMERKKRMLTTPSHRRQIFLWRWLFFGRWLPANLDRVTRRGGKAYKFYSFILHIICSFRCLILSTLSALRIFTTQGCYFRFWNEGGSTLEWRDWCLKNKFMNSSKRPVKPLNQEKSPIRENNLLFEFKEK